MNKIGRFRSGVVAGVALAVAGCENEPSTASRSAAAYDEAREKGVPLGGGGHGHGGRDHASPAGGPGGVPGESDHDAHRTAGAQGDGTERPLGEMDHAATGHGPAGATREAGRG